MSTTGTSTVPAAVGAGALAVVVVLIVAVTGLAGSLARITSPAPGPVAVEGIPSDYLALYIAAATTCPGLHWSVLAAVGKVETDHGRTPFPGVHSGQNHAGARGPMQFLQPTFDAVTAEHPPPPGGATPPSPYNPHDAIYTAAAYLCDNGARDNRDLPAAVFTYNHSTAYVENVLAVARDYATLAATPANRIIDAAIGYALSQLGQPYLWGGDGPAHGEAGFDCSGLTTAAYQAAGLTLPRVAQAQHDHGPPVPTGQPLQPGDLLFYGTPTAIHHVGLYLGNNHMINAPDVGQPVQITPYRWPGDDYAGATRPAAGHAPPSPTVRPSE